MRPEMRRSMRVVTAPVTRMTGATQLPPGVVGSSGHGSAPVHAYFGSEEPFRNVLRHYRQPLSTCRARLVSRLDADLTTLGLAAHIRRGKLLRPLVLYLFGLSAGGSVESLHPGAEAIELLHAASLLHDDIVDESAERRGQPALHTKVGTKGAVVLGDYLVFLAFHVLAKADSAHKNGRVVAAVERLSHYGRACCV